MVVVSETKLFEDGKERTSDTVILKRWKPPPTNTVEWNTLFTMLFSSHSTTVGR